MSDEDNDADFQEEEEELSDADDADEVVADADAEEDVEVEDEEAVAAPVGWQSWRKRRRRKARREQGGTPSDARALFLASASATARRTGAPIEERGDGGNPQRPQARCGHLRFGGQDRLRAGALRRVRGFGGCRSW